jgi:hypothetical protein
LKKTQVYESIKKGKEGKLVVEHRHLNAKRQVRNLVFVAVITVDVESSMCVNVRNLLGPVACNLDCKFLNC